MRKPTCLTFALGLALSAAAAPLAHSGPSIVIDVQSGQVTHAEDVYRRWSPASLTKLMTAWMTFRAIDDGSLTMTSPVRMSVVAAEQPPSKMGYRAGSVMTIDNALKMVIIRSANDVSVALGEAVAGSRDAFVAAMNAEAKRLGMTSTNFVNPHGLHDPEQFTTARDMALLARAIRTQYPQYEQYFDAEALRIGETVTPTYNILLGRYDGADGMKTGFVCAAGFNIVASATRQNSTLIAVVLGEKSPKTRAEESATLLEDGFNKLASGSTLPTLETLPVDAEMAAMPPADLRAEICSEEARAARWEGRSVEGYLEFATPYLGKMDRDPIAITAGLGGADGQSASAVVLNGVVIGSYPVPAPKPDRPSLVDENDLERFGLRPGFDVPVPGVRPQISDKS